MASIRRKLRGWLPKAQYVQELLLAPRLARGATYRKGNLMPLIKKVARILGHNAKTTGQAIDSGQGKGDLHK